MDIEEDGLPTLKEEEDNNVVDEVMVEFDLPTLIENHRELCLINMSII
jgi:hypothetical protein